MAAFHSNVPLALEPAVVYSLKGDHGYLFCPGTKDNVYIDRNSTKLFNTLWKDLVLGSKINVTTTNTASAAEKNAELIADMLVVRVQGFFYFLLKHKLCSLGFFCRFVGIGLDFGRS